MFQIYQANTQVGISDTLASKTSNSTPVGTFSQSYFQSLLYQEQAKSSDAAISSEINGRHGSSSFGKADLDMNSVVDSRLLLGKKSVQITGPSTDVSLVNEDDNSVCIGTITDKISTVSELLYASGYQKECWNILAKDVNSTKPFRRIPPGTKIYLDRITSEIRWGQKSDIATKMPDKIQAQPAEPGPEILPQIPLNHAVSKFIGQDYDQMDCYEMVVEGLKDMGVSYQGRNGLGRYLMAKAKGEGLASNHYLNGEGLVKAAGESVYHKKLLRVGNPETQAKTIMNEMETVLKTGQILSFSTQSRGHTGVISRQENIWTFINSGTMDHNIAGDNGSKGVGEEILAKELENWLKLAEENGEGLQITLGDIDPSKLAHYRDGHDVGRTVAMSG